MRLVSAGNRRGIAQRVLRTMALALVLAAAIATPAFAAGPDVVGTAAAALPAQASAPLAGAAEALPPATQPVRQAVDAVAPVERSVDRAAGSLAAPARRVVEEAAPAVSSAPRSDEPLAAATSGSARPELAAATDTTATELRRRAAVLPPVTGRELSALPVVDGLDESLHALGDALRSLVPVDSLATPLLAGVGLGELTVPALGLAERPLPSSAAPALPLDGRGAPSGGPLGTGERGLAPTAGHVAAGPTASPIQSASAQPPAAEAGGRPGSPPPRKAPAPAVGGAAISAPGGFLFAPFLALLVLAALAAPPLMRRLDVALAFLRPAPFVCALERPG